MGNTQRFWEMDHGPSARMAGQHRSWANDYDEDGDEVEFPEEILDEEE